MGKQGQGSGIAGTLGMGFFAGVLSTPCSGALLGFVLVWAQTQPLIISSTAIILMGVGMSLPYAVIILIPSLLNQGDAISTSLLFSTMMYYNSLNTLCQNKFRAGHPFIAISEEIIRQA